MHIQIYVICAFLNGLLKQPVYMYIPKGLNLPNVDKSVCKLFKSLYGLRQSPKCWYERLNDYLC